MLGSHSDRHFVTMQVDGHATVLTLENDGIAFGKLGARSSLERAMEGRTGFTTRLRR